MSGQGGDVGGSQTGPADHGFVTLRLHGQWLGVPVVLIQEVLPGQTITPVPLAPPTVAGLLNLRGQIVTAVDLRAVLGLPPREAGAGFMNVVVRQEDELFSLIVDEVGDVLDVAADAVEPTPDTLDSTWKRCSRGVLRLETALLVVLDVNEVLGVSPADAP